MPFWFIARNNSLSISRLHHWGRLIIAFSGLWCYNTFIKGIGTDAL
jgi:hypothetical protein